MSERSLELRPITMQNFEECIGLTVAEHQRGFVASNVYSLAEAKADGVSIPRAIYFQADMVGFAMFCFDAASGTGYLDRLMIAAEHQSRGYGKAALSAVIAKLQAMHGCKRIRTAIAPTNEAAERLYHRSGFRRTGRVVGDGEAEMILDLVEDA